MATPPTSAWWLESGRAGGRWPFALAGTGGAHAWLHAHGLVGRRLGVVSANTPALAQLIAAAARAGSDLVLINHRLVPAERDALVARAGLDAIALGDGAPAPPGVRALALPPAFPAAPAPAASDGDGALVVFTSGSTGAAKAVRLPWARLHRAAAAAAVHLGFDAADAWLACLPLDHIGGASIILRALLTGQRLRLHARFAADAVGADLDGGAIAGVSLVPTMLHRLVAARGDRRWHPALRLALVGGAGLAPTLAERAAALGCAPCASYGLTETASQACTMRPGEPAAPGSVGTPLPGLEMAIEEPDRDGVGTIAVRGVHLFAGYEDGGRLVAPHEDGAWFATGDLGRVDAGRLVVLGRRDEVIVSGGEKVPPQAVEAVLMGHPAIAEALVAGVPDPEWGQVVVAALVARGAPPDEDALAGWLRERLAPFRRPKRWRWVDALPATPSGKPLRRAIASLFAD